MKKYRFIINPISGVGKQKVLENLLPKHLDQHAIEWEVTYTEAAGHAVDLSREAAQKGWDAAVVVGGDGSVNEAAQGLVHQQHCALGIIPTGSGNGFARHLGLPIGLKHAVQSLNTARPFIIDTAMANQSLFVGTAGVGFDAHIGFLFSEYGTRGFLSYIRLVLREFHQYQARKFQLEIDGQRLERHAMIIAIANSSQYGNNAFLSPHSLLADEQLEVCILNDCPKWAFPDLVMRLFRGTLEGSPYYEMLPARRVRIVQPDLTAHLDGEPMELGQNLDIQIQPASLPVLVPPIVKAI
ncbi:MAG: diacylglycerol/lipid kinase family protein [Salibacteraceae bacterium]